MSIAQLDDDKERLPKWPQLLFEVVSLDWYAQKKIKIQIKICEFSSTKNCIPIIGGDDSVWRVMATPRCPLNQELAGNDDQSLAVFVTGCPQTKRSGCPF